MNKASQTAGLVRICWAGRDAIVMRNCTGSKKGTTAATTTATARAGVMATATATAATTATGSHPAVPMPAGMRVGSARSVPACERVSLPI